jgi:iron complex outermembrane receptor protein
MEAQATFNLTGGLDLNFGVGIDHNKITDFSDPTAIGNHVPIVPNYTVNVGMQYRHSITPDYDGIVRIDYRRLGRTWWEPYNTTNRNPLDLADGRFSIEGHGLTMTAWVKNLTNKKYNAEFSPGGFVFKAEPRTWGFDLTKKF